MKLSHFFDRIFHSALWKILAVLMTTLLLLAVARLLWGIYYASDLVLGGSRSYNIVAAEYIHEIYSWGVLAAVLLLLIALAGVADLWLGWSAARQFRDVTGAIQSFAQEDFGQRVMVDRYSNSDAVRLGRAFNSMADRIALMVEQLRERDLLRRELVANVAHDLGTPATSIQGYAETLVMKELEPADRRRYLDVILANARVVSMLVRELFELTKLDDPDLSPHREPFSIEVLAGDVVSRLEPLAEKEGVEIGIESAADLPLVLADIDMIERALSNLIENAINYTSAGGMVRVGFRPRKEKVLVFVRDSGVGMEQADLELLFKRYYRGLEARRRKISGSGLGLAIVKRIVELHEGAIEVCSGLNQGTEVGFCLPVAGRGIDG